MSAIHSGMAGWQGRAQTDLLNPTARWQMFLGRPEDHATNNRADPRG